MRRTLGVLSLLLVLSACGDDASDDSPGDGAGTDPATSEPTTSPSPTGTDPTSSPSPTAPAGAAGVVAILHETAAGGREAAGAPAVRIDTADGLRAFTALLTGDGLIRQVETTAAGIRLRGGQGLYAAVIAIGCDVPPGATVQVAGGVVTVTPAKVTAPMRECFAPVTSVAIVTAPVS